MVRHSNDREPCPWRIIEDLGGGYCFGMALGSIWHGIAGLRNAPSNNRWQSCISRVSGRVPLMAGGFAMWAMTYSFYECGISSFRGKEDLWNPIASGALTGGTLAARAGPRVAGQQFMIGGLILAGIEGLSVYVNRTLVPWMSSSAGPVDPLDPPVDMFYKHRTQSTGIRDFGSTTGSGLGLSTGSNKGFDLDDLYKTK